jgi:hypothetical protein
MCPQNLGHLSAKLPLYPLADLHRVRSAILQEDVAAAHRRLAASGAGTRRGLESLLADATEAEAGVERASACMKSVARDPNAMKLEIEAGRFDFSRPDSIASICAASYVLARYAATGLREMATALACHATE